MELTRRRFAESLLAVGGAAVLPGCLSSGRGATDYEETLQDRCWMQGDDVGYFDNLSVVRWDRSPSEFCRRFAELRRVTWPIGGPSSKPGMRFDDLCEDGFGLLDEMPNLIGFELDDFFRPHLPPVTVNTPSGPRLSLQSAFPYDRLAALRRRLDGCSRELDLRLPVSDELLDRENLIVPCADQATTVMFWVRKGRDLMDLERIFRRYRTLLPFKPTFLGVRLCDFGAHRPMSMDCLRHELAYGLELWHRREIEGFVFLASSRCDKDLQTEEYARQWIAVHGDEQRLPEPETYFIGNIASRIDSGSDNRRVHKAFEFLHRDDLASLPVGRYSIDGDNVFALVQDCELRRTDDVRDAEVHRRYIDIQTPLTGEETYGVARLSDANFRKVFDSLADIQRCEQGLDYFTLRPGQFAAFLPPRCLHAPGLAFGEPRRIRKLVVKVKYRT